MRTPTAIQLHKASKTLSVSYGAETFELPAEFLRVHSPSAEVQGHGNPVLQWGKQQVGISAVEPAGRYAIKLTFDDGHDSGLFSWDYLYELAVAATNSGPTTWNSWPAPARRGTHTSARSS